MIAEELLEHNNIMYIVHACILSVVNSNYMKLKVISN